MKTRWKKLAAIAATCVMASTTALGFAACGKKSGPHDHWYDTAGGWKNEKEYTYYDYSVTIPSLWNELASTDGGDRDIMGYINSAFFEFDFKFDDKGEIVPGEFTVVPSAATKLEDVTSQYKGKYGIAADDTVGHRAWKYTLRNDLKWDDGTAIKASDFVYTMEKQLNGKYKYDQAANMWNGNYILHNAKEYFYQGTYGYTNMISADYGDDEYVDVDDMTVTADGTLQVNGADVTINLRSGGNWGSYGLGTYYNAYGTGELTAAWQAVAAKADADGYVKLTKDDVVLIWDMIAEIQGFENAADYEAEVGDYAYVEWEEFCFYGKTYEALDFSEVGIFAPSDTELVIVYDNANLKPIDEDGNLTYEAAYYFSSLPLVKKDLWDKLEVEPTGSSTVWTNNYNALSVANSASWGPYKLSNYQAGTTYTLSRNDKWYGYNMDQYDGQYQTDSIVVRQVAEWNTAWQMFQKGEVTGIGIDVSIANDYRNSSRAVYTPTSGVSTYFLQCNEGALTKEKGNALLKYHDFREAFSLALDRTAWCQELTTSYQPSLGIYNDLIYYDVANGGVYRFTEPAKEVLLTTYGAEKQSNGKWKVGNKTYSDIDDALDALTGYNLNKAKELFNSAYDAALAAGDIDANGKVTLRYGATEENESVKRTINFLNKMFETATTGTKLEGRVTVEFFEMNDASWIEDFRSGGQFDICAAYVSGGAWNPYYSLQIYILDSQRLTLGWDTSAEKLTLTVKGGEGQDDVTDTLSLVDWFNCLNGLSGCKYNLSLYPTDSKLAVTAALEGAVLQSYTSLPCGSMTSASLLSYRCEYITYEYNTFMSFGGIQYLCYKYDDAEWAEYVSSQGGTLDYKK